MRISDWSSDVCSSDLPEHDVDRADDRGRIREHVALAHEIHRLEVAERRRADLAAVRFVAAVANQIDAELAFRALSRDVNLARGDVEALGIELEMMDQRFHRLLHLAALRRDDLAVEARDRAARSDELTSELQSLIRS